MLKLKKKQQVILWADWKFWLNGESKYIWGASQVVPVVKNLPANAGDTRDMDSIHGQEDPLEEGTPVFLPGESHGQMILVDYNPKSHNDLDMSEAT